MEVHQHSNGLADDERDPHSRVAIVPVEEATHKPSQRNLRPPQKKKKERFIGLKCVRARDYGEGGEWELSYLSHHPHKGPNSEHLEWNTHQVLKHKERYKNANCSNVSGVKCPIRFCPITHLLRAHS